MTPSRAAARPASRATGRRGPHLGPVPITPLSVLVVLLVLGAPALMLYAIGAVKDEGQVTLLEVGSIGLAIGFALWALASLRAMWRAAANARSGRAMVFAIIGGLAGIGAIGSIAMTFVLVLLWGS
ncbi:MAG: hypothetical protein FIA92_04125 [Chloroflexi bacterium]|nr:hypothetical protein [Chloroflexota bacterium]